MAKVDGDFESAGWTKPPSIPFRLAAGMEARELLAYLHQGPWQDIGATAPELWSSMTTTPPSAMTMSSPVSFHSVSDLHPGP